MIDKTLRSKTSLIFQVLVLIWIAQPIFAQASALSTIHFDSANPPRLGPSISYFEDPTGSLGVTDAAGMPYEAISTQELNFGYTTSIFWLRFTLSNDDLEPAEVVLQTSARFMRPLEVFIENDKAAFTRVLYNDEHSKFGNRPGGSRHLGAVLTVPPGQPVTVYVRFGAGGLAAMSLKLTNLIEVEREQQSLVLRAAIFISIIGTLILTNLFFFAATRAWVYLTYAVQEFSFIVYVSHMDGLTFQYLWPNWPALNANATPVLGGLVIAAALWFSIAFLQSARYTPRFYKVLLGLLAIVILDVVLSIFLPNRLTNQIGLSLFFVVAAVLIPHALYVLSQGHLATRFYLGGWLILIGVTGLYSSSMLFGLSLPIAPTELIKIGMVGEAIVLAMGLADQYRRLNSDRNNIHANLISQLQARLDESRERVQLEQEKDEALRDFADSSRTLATASHDIAQPLMAIKYAIQNASLENQAEMAKSVTESLSDLEVLVNDTLDNATDAMEQASLIVTTDVGQLIHEACQNHYDAALKKRLFIREHAIVLSAQTNRTALKRCMSNLIGNAVNYTDHGGILVAARKRQNGLIFQVYDTGRGMDAKEVQYMLNALNKDDSSSGKGLGLSIVQEICDEAGWDLQIRSEKGVGSCFSVWIPGALNHD